MAKSLLEHLWTDRKKSVLLALDLIKKYYRDERVMSGKGTKDEYQAMRSPVDEEIRA